MMKDSVLTIEGRVNNPNLWTSETPYLYTVKYTLQSDKKKAV